MCPDVAEPYPRNPSYFDRRTTLLYTDPAEDVELVTFMPRFPSPIDFDCLDGPDGAYWELELELPEDARIEYRIGVTNAGSQSLILDPRNPDKGTNPFGVNSVAGGPDYRRPDWWDRTDAPPGSVRELRVTSGVFAGRRTHHIYSPSGVPARTPLPLLVVHDGSDYFDHARLGRCLDVLIGDGVIAPIRAVLLDPVERNREYVGLADHADHLAGEVIPHVRRRYRVDGRATVMGASLGAVASWHALRSHPDVLSDLFIQSGTFAYEESRMLEEGMATSIRAFLSTVSDPTHLAGRTVVQTCGRYESLIEWNRRVANLIGPVCDHRYSESWSGHDWGAWADEFEFGLGALFGRGDGTGHSAPL